MLDWMNNPIDESVSYIYVLSVPIIFIGILLYGLRFTRSEESKKNKLVD